MTERDLENLKHLPVPPQRHEKKRAAINAALDAFDRSENSSQGNVVPLRQTETSESKRKRKMIFTSRQSQALAASVVALAIVAPIAFQNLRDSRLLRPEDFSRAKEQLSGVVATGGERAQPPAPAAPVASPQVAQINRASNDSVANATTIAPPAAGADEQLSEKGRVLPPDLVGKSAIGANGQEPGRHPIDGLGAVGDLSLPKPWNATPDSTVAAPPPAKFKSARDMDIQLSRGMIARSDDQRIILQEQENRDKFEAKEINPVKQVATQPVSTFSIDVDTASYAFVRRALNGGHLPPKDAVRVEEMINYFPYAYPAPETAETPFKPTITVMPSPWNANNKLVHVAIKGYDLKSAERPRANLVFLLDVSGSMSGEDRLPLVKNAFKLLLDQLKPDDTVGIVTYASGSGIALEPTKVADKSKILRAIDQLGAGGSTAGAEGIQDAYRLAEAGFEKNAVNRIILATDGDFNVGVTDQNQLKGLIERKRQSGIFLSILGVGQGNHNDALMQTLAQNGNGTAAYVDTLNEARKVLVDQASSTLFTIAKDVKAQIEWNPARVSEYRLIGYETRNLKREDFNNDRVDAGDIGSGHTVTAIYEVTPVGAPRLVEDLRYGNVAAAAKPEATTQAAAPLAADATSSELGFLKLRYKRPNEETSQLLSLPIPAGELVVESFSKNFKEQQSLKSEVAFSVAVAAFGQLLKGAPYMQGYSYDDVLKLAGPARGDDTYGYRAEFLTMVRLAKSARP